MKEIQAVLFDLDGTLVDSEPGILTSFAKAFEPYGITLSQEQKRSLLGPPLKDSFARFLPPDQVERAVAAYRAFYETNGIYQCTVYDGVETMLSSLHANGFVLGLATCKLRKAARTMLEFLHLDQYFDYLGGAVPELDLETKAQVIDDVLAQPCFAGKTAVMVGDRDNDMQGAAACGLPVIAAGYGYGTPQELQAFSPVYYAKTPMDVSSWLLGQNDNETEETT